MEEAKPSCIFIALQDLRGQPILNFRHEFSLFKKYSIYAGANDQKLLATIKAHTMMGITADIDFTNLDGTPRCTKPSLFDTPALSAHTNLLSSMGPGREFFR